jgi:hypothetical protein
VEPAELGPWELVRRLTAWAEDRSWVEWLELGGSLGRGAGDAWSDVDAAIGLSPEAPDDAVTQVLGDLAGFRPPAGIRTEEWAGSGRHLSIVFVDGSELSLVVMDAESRDGLPPQSRRLLDRQGRLAVSLPAARWTPDDATRAAWAHEAWALLADAGRHAVRGERWRALASLSAARDRAFRLWADSRRLTYPSFGATTVENAEAPLPDGIDATHPAALDRAALDAAIDAMTAVLQPLTPQASAAVALAVRHRLRRLRNDRNPSVGGSTGA